MRAEGEKEGVPIFEHDDFALKPLMGKKFGFLPSITFRDETAKLKFKKFSFISPICKFKTP